MFSMVVLVWIRYVKKRFKKMITLFEESNMFILYLGIVSVSVFVVKNYFWDVSEY